MDRYSLGGGPSTPDIARESFTENKETGWLQVNPSAMLQEHAAGSGARIAQSLEVEALDRVYNALGERYAEARAEVEMLQRQVSNTLPPSGHSTPLLTPFNADSCHCDAILRPF